MKGKEYRKPQEFLNNDNGFEISKREADQSLSVIR